MEREFAVWRDLEALFLGRLLQGSYSMSRKGLVIVKTPSGIKTAELGGSPAIFVAKGLLRELAAESTHRGATMGQGCAEGCSASCLLVCFRPDYVSGNERSNKG